MPVRVQGWIFVALSEAVSGSALHIRAAGLLQLPERYFRQIALYHFNHILDDAQIFVGEQIQEQDALLAVGAAVGGLRIADNKGGNGGAVRRSWRGRINLSQIRVLPFDRPQPGQTRCPKPQGKSMGISMFADVLLQIRDQLIEIRSLEGLLFKRGSSCSGFHAPLGRFLVQHADRGLSFFGDNLFVVDLNHLLGVEAQRVLVLLPSVARIRRLLAYDVLDDGCDGDGVGGYITTRTGSLGAEISCLDGIAFFRFRKSIRQHTFYWLPRLLDCTNLVQ